MHVSPPAGPAAQGALLRVSPGHRGPAEGGGRLGIGARQGAQKDHGRRCVWTPAAPPALIGAPLISPQGHGSIRQGACVCAPRNYIVPFLKASIGRLNGPCFIFVVTARFSSTTVLA